LRPRRTPRLRGVARPAALAPRPAGRRRVVFGGSRLRPPRPSRMPAFGLKGGVGRVTPPTLRPCLLL
jgi:hypothetical protein